ncbi:hypothetical protein F5X98DRAFT_382917 [Xylaria grammica]|nr:hypothetical protein F5X98DRAFT_382917 [Xylaria grammica]
MAFSNTTTSLLDSPDNHGAVINVVSWFLLILSWLVVFTRLGTRWALSKELHMDDVIIILAQISNTGQTATTSIGVSNGLGRHLGTLTHGNLLGFQKSFYAAGLLFIVNQALSKLSATMVIRNLSVALLHKRLSQVLNCLTFIWALTSIAPLLFQCKAPRLWNFLGNGCLNRKAIWYYIITTNILLDAGLIALPFAVLWHLQISLARKVAVFACFALRILVIAALIWQIVESRNISDRQDPTFLYWTFAISTSVTQNLAVVVACIPYLKPFLDSLESGLIRSDDIRRRGNLAGKSTSSNYHNQTDETASSHAMQDLGPSETGATVSVVVGNEQRDDWEGESHSSEANLIKQVRTWGVTRSSAVGRTQSSAASPGT